MLDSIPRRYLIECRDRPSDGAAPRSWIEQLIGRRELDGFDKVMAVSTTGFSPVALHAADKGGIYLREVKDLVPEDIVDWLNLSKLVVRAQGFLADTVIHVADIKGHQQLSKLLGKRARKSVQDRIILERPGAAEKLVVVSTKLMQGSQFVPVVGCSDR